MWFPGPPGKGGVWWWGERAPENGEGILARGVGEVERAGLGERWGGKRRGAGGGGVSPPPGVSPGNWEEAPKVPRGRGNN